MEEEEGPPRTAVSEIERLSKCSGALTRTDIRLINKVAELGMDVLRAGVHNLVRVAAGDAILTSKSADATPIVVKKRVTANLPGSSTTIHRSGKEKLDFLIRNQFFRCAQLNGRMLTKAYLADPVAMRFGKTVHAELTICRRDWFSLRQLGHRGFAVEHYCFDRLGLEALERTILQYHAHDAPSYDFLAPPGLPAHLFRKTEIVLVTGCAAHDAHNGLKWGHFQEFRNAELTRDCFVAVESLRNSADLIYRFLGEWVGQVIRLVDESPSFVVDEKRALWTALGLGLEQVSLLSEVLEYEFFEGEILVARSAANVGDPVTLVVGALMASWSFVRFTDSRWLTIGPSARGMVVGLLTGLSSYVGFVEQQKGISLYYLKGFHRVEGAVASFFAKVALTSRVADKVLQTLLSDPRVLIQYESLWTGLAGEVRWVSELPSGIWKTMAALADEDVESFRTEVVCSCHVIFHFFWRRVLRVAGEEPWCYALGDVRANVDALAAEEEAPESRVGEQLWELLQAGHSREQIVRAVECFRDVNWTTTIAEQQHGSLAALRRHHSEYGAETLTGRAAVMQLRRLLPKATAEEAELEKVTRQISKECARKPESVSGRQVWFGELVKEAKDKDWGARVPPTEKFLMERHSAVWQAKTDEDMRFWEMEARARKSANREALTKAVDELRARADELRVKIATVAEKTRPISMSEAAMSAQDLSLFDRFLADQQISHTVISTRREQTLQCPPPPPQALRDALDAQGSFGTDSIPLPAWAKAVVARRKSFHRCIFAIEREGVDTTYWKYLYAVQQPYLLALCEVELLETFQPVAPPQHVSEYAYLYAFHQEFFCNFAKLATSDGLDEVEEKDIVVYQNLDHCGGTKILCREPPLPLSLLLRTMELDTVVTAKETKKSQKKAKEDEELHLLYPWLAEAMDLSKGFTATKAQKEKGEGEGSSSDEEAGKKPLSDAELSDVWKTLAKARAHLASLPGATSECFNTRVLGGGWTAENVGCAYDAIQGYARNQQGVQFLQRRGLQKSMRFNTRSFGPATCGVLARAWIHKSQFFLDVEVLNPEYEGLPFPGGLADTYLEPSDLSALADGAPAELQAAIRGIRNFLAPVA